LSKYRVMYSQGNGEHCCCHRDAWLCIDDFDTVEQLREYLIEFYLNDSGFKKIGESSEKISVQCPEL